MNSIDNMCMKSEMTIDSDASHLIAETPAERRRRKVRDAIIAAAERVFAKEGAEGLSIRRLAEEIDYSPSAIYKYFSSKTELLTVLKEAFFEDLIAEIEMVKAREGQELAVCVRECITTYILTALKRPHHYAAAFSGTDEISDWMTEQSEDGTISYRTRAFDMLHELVTLCVENGVFREDLRIAAAAKSLWASMHGLAMLMVHLPAFGMKEMDDLPAMSAREFMDFHADLIARGLEA